MFTTKIYVYNIYFIFLKNLEWILLLSLGLRCFPGSWIVSSPGKIFGYSQLVISMNYCYLLTIVQRSCCMLIWQSVQLNRIFVAFDFFVLLFVIISYQIVSVTM